MHAAAWHAEQKQKAIHPDPSPAVALDRSSSQISIKLLDKTSAM
jgi:hypothetical protein